jgi:hypothetical protein
MSGYPSCTGLDTSFVLRLLLGEPTGQSLDVLAQSNLGRAKPGFVDRMIHAEYLQTSSGMLTFEKAAAKLNKVTIPQ